MVTMRMILKAQTYLGSYLKGPNIVWKFDAFELEMSVHDLSNILNDSVDIEGRLKIEAGHETIQD